MSTHTLELGDTVTSRATGRSIVGLLPTWLASPGQRSAGGGPGSQEGTGPGQDPPRGRSRRGPRTVTCKAPGTHSSLPNAGGLRTARGMPAVQAPAREGLLPRRGNWRPCPHSHQARGRGDPRPGVGEGPGPGARRPRVPEALGCEPREHIPVRQASKDSLKEKDTSTAMSFLVSLPLPLPLPVLMCVWSLIFFFLSRAGVWQHIYI